MSITIRVSTLVLVEGESDAEAVRALADLIGCDLNSGQVQIVPAGGVTNFSAVLSQLLRLHPGVGVCGLYDIADERYVRKALARVGAKIAADQPLDAAGFFACVADLEDELIRALGSATVERVLEAQGELASFRRFQGMPQHRNTHVHRQLRRFLGTRATRKIRSARNLVQVMDAMNLPRPLSQLASRLRGTDRSAA